MICGMSTVAIANDSIHPFEADQETYVDYKSGAISGSDNIKFNHSDTITVNRNGTYTGNTYIESGRVDLGHDDVFATDKTLTIAKGGTLNLSAENQTVGKLVGDGVIQMSKGNLYVEYAEGTESQTINNAFYDAEGTTLGFKFKGETQTVVLAATEGSFGGQGGTLVISNANLELKTKKFDGMNLVLDDGGSLVLQDDTTVNTLASTGTGSRIVFTHGNTYALTVNNGIVVQDGATIELDLAGKSLEFIDVLKVDNGVSRDLIKSEKALKVTKDDFKVLDFVKPTDIFDEQTKNKVGEISWEETGGLKVNDNSVVYEYKLGQLKLIGKGEEAVILSTADEDVDLDTHVTGEGDIALTQGHVVFRNTGTFDYTGTTFVRKGQYSSEKMFTELRIEDGADISQSELIYVEDGAQIRFEGNGKNDTAHVIQALGGDGSLLIFSDSSLKIADKKNATESLIITNQIINWGVFEISRVEKGSLIFAEEWADYHQGRFVLTNVDFSLEHAGNRQKAYGTPYLTIGQNTTMKVGPEIFNHEKHKFQSLTIDGGEVVFTGILLDVNQAQKPFLDAESLHGSSSDAVFKVELDKQAQSGFSLWNNQVEKFETLVSAQSVDDLSLKADFIDKDGNTIVYDENGYFVQTLNQNNDSLDEAKLYWDINNKGWEGATNKYLYSAVLKQIELLNVNEDQGYVASVDGDHELSVKLTGVGNIRFEKDANLVGTGTVVVTNENTYTGKTTVGSNLSLLLDADNALGETLDLDIAEGSYVNLNGKSQTVHGLSGTGIFNLAGQSTLRLTAVDNEKEDKTVTAHITNASSESSLSGQTFEIDLNGGEVVFTHEENNFTGNVNLTNVRATIQENSDKNRNGTFFSHTHTNLGTGADITIDTGKTSRTWNDFGTLTFDGGTLTIVDGTVFVHDASIQSESTIRINAAQKVFDIWKAYESQNSVVLVSENKIGGYENLSYLNLSLTSEDNKKQSVSYDDWKEVAKVTWTETKLGWDSEDYVQINAWYKLADFELTNTEDNKGYVVGVVGTKNLAVKLRGAGNVIFTGEKNESGNSVTISNAQNNYTGKTYVGADYRGGTAVTVIAGVDQAFGDTKELTIVKGGIVDLGIHQQDVGQLNVDQGSIVLAQKSILKVTGKNADSLESMISGANALQGQGLVDIAVGLTLSVAGEQSYSGRIDMHKGGTLVLKQGDVLRYAKNIVFGDGDSENNRATVQVNSTDETVLTGQFTGNAKLVLANQTQLSLDGGENGSNFSGIKHIEFQEKSTASLALNSQTVGKLENTTTIDTTSGTVAIELSTAGTDQTMTVGQKVFGDGVLKLESHSETNVIAFASGGVGSFQGSVQASNVSLKHSGTSEQFRNAAVVLENNAKYVVDKVDAKIGSLTVNKSSILDFDSPALPGTEQTDYVLTVTGDLVINQGTVNVKYDDVKSITKVADKGNVLEQDTGNDKVILAYGNDVSVSDAILTVGGKEVKGSSQTFTIKQEGNNANIVGTYDYKLGTDNDKKQLYVTYGLTEVAVSGGSLWLGTAKDNPDSTFSAKITGTGGVVIDTLSESVTLDRENAYTGLTEVNNGNLILSADKALNGTSGLEVVKDTTTVTITEGEQIINGKLSVEGSLVLQERTTLKFEGGEVANLKTASAGALVSTDDFTIKNSASIVGANSGLEGKVTILREANAGIDNALGLGSGEINLVGQLNVGIADVASDKVFKNKFTGAGVFNLTAGLGVEIEKDIQDFTGSFIVEKDTSLAMGTSEAKRSLQLSGAGSVIFSGRNAQTHTVLTLTGTENLGALTIKKTLMSMRGDTLDKAQNIQVLNVNENSKVVLDKGTTSLKEVVLDNGTLDFTSAGALWGINGDADTVLYTEKFDAVTGNIKVDSEALINPNPTDSDRLGLMSQDEVLSADQAKELYVTLIHSEKEIEEEDVGHLTLIGFDDQNLTSTFGIGAGTEKVAEGTYSYGLSKGEDGKSIGIGYQLTSVKLLKDKELVLNARKSEDNTLSAQVTGDGNLRVSGGEVTLSSAKNDYTGHTTVDAGATLVVHAGSSLGQTSGLTNDGTVEANQNDLKVYGKTDNNATGTLVVGDKTFTTESYHGEKGSQINVNTLLKGNDGSETGMMVVNGAATGESTLNVTVREGSQALELDKLGVVKMAESSTLELTLSNEIKLGEYQYVLNKTDKSDLWYLTATKTGDGDGMSTSEMKTPESGARAGLAFLATEAFDLSLRGHVGDRVYTDPVTGEERESSFWMIQMGNWSSFGDTTGQLDFDGRTFVTHMGSDIYKRVNEDSDLRFGLLGSFADISYDVESNITGMTADAKSDGWSVGAYAYWQTTEESGPFANAQIRWNRFNNEVTGELTTTDKYHADGVSLTVEGGWTYRLYTRKPTDGQSGLAWNIEPRVHAHWTPFNTESDVDSKGQSYETDGKGNLALWLGVRTNLKMTDRTMPTWDNPAVNLFAEGHWVHNTRDFSSTVTSELGSSTAVVGVRDFGEARLGAIAHFNEDFVLWGDVNYRAGESNYESVGFTLGAKYHF